MKYIKLKNNPRRLIYFNCTRKSKKFGQIKPFSEPRLKFADNLNEAFRFCTDFYLGNSMVLKLEGNLNLFRTRERKQ